MSSSMSEVIPFAKPFPCRHELIEEAAKLIRQVLRPSSTDFMGQSKEVGEVLNEVGRHVVSELMVEKSEALAAKVEIHGGTYRRGRRSKARVHTRFGVVKVPSRLYHRLQRLDSETLPGPPRLNSVELSCGVLEGLCPVMAEIVCRFEASVPSREGVELMSLCGVRPPSRASCERKADTIGGLLKGDLSHELARLRGRTKLPAEVASVTIGLDRVSVAYRKPAPELEGKAVERTKPYTRKAPERFKIAWKMDFVGNVSFRDAEGELVLSYRYGLPHHQPGQQIAQELVKDVAWALEQNPELKVAVCQDGARELWPLIDDALQDCEALSAVEVHRVVDFEHLRPRLEAMKKALRWSAKTLDAMFKVLVEEEDGIQQVEARVLADFHDRLSCAKQALVGDFLSYLEGRIGDFDGASTLFNYKKQRDLGLPIGSGPVEATAKTLVSVRMKRSGCRWIHGGAHTVLILRGLTRSDGRWTPFWTNFIEQRTAQTIQQTPSNVVPLRP